MKIRTIEDFARPQDIAALRGVMSQLITRFPQNGEGGIPSRPPSARREKAVAARIETGEALPHTLAKASPRRSAIIFGKRALSE